MMEALQLAGRSILIVEDQPLVAFDLQEILEGAGACVVCAARLETGLELADLPGLSVAIVDFGLGTSNGAEICNKLCARGVPFLFHSGRPGSEFVRWPEAPVVGKPAFCDALLA